MIVSYLSVNEALDKEYFQELQQRLPQDLRKQNDRYRHYLDQQRNLFGLLLLQKLWSDQFNQSLNLEKLQSTQYRRPFLPNQPADFNISHAGDYVICVLHPAARVGIDIEKRKKVKFDDFNRTMNPAQWEEIKNSTDPEAKFFKYWCIKESVIKADGRGLSIPLTDIIINTETVAYADQSWYVKPFQLDAEHFGCLACYDKIDRVNIKEAHWDSV